MIARSVTARDRGTLLPLVMVFVVVLGVVVLALASYAGASLRYGRVAANRTDRLAAADAGIRFAVEQLRLNDSLCTTALGSGGVNVPAPTINGATVSVSCRRASTGADDTAGWAVVVTGGQNGTGGTGKLLQNGGSQPALIGGRTYLADPTGHGPFTAAGDVWYGATNCGAAAPPTGITQDPGYTLNCVEQPWNVLFTEPDVPTASQEGSLHELTTPDCDVHTPGWYATGLTVERNAYFMSGEYHFGGPLEIGDGATALAGFADGLGDAQALGGEGRFAFPTGFDACRFAQQFDRTNNAPFGGGRGGVTMYFADGARVTVNTGASGYLEIMRRQQGGRPVSIHDLDDSRGIGAAPVVDTTPGADHTLVIHGSIWAPYARLAINANGSNWGAASGGVVAGHIDYRVADSPPPFLFGVETSTTPIRLVLTSTATDSEGVSTAVRAVAEVVPGQTEGQVLLNSWRVCGAAC